MEARKKGAEELDEMSPRSPGAEELDEMSPCSPRTKKKWMFLRRNKKMKKSHASHVAVSGELGLCRSKEVPRNQLKMKGRSMTHVMYLFVRGVLIVSWRLRRRHHIVEMEMKKQMQFLTIMWTTGSCATAKGQRALQWS